MSRAVVCARMCLLVIVAGGKGHDITGLGLLKPVVVHFHQLNRYFTGIGVFVCFLIVLGFLFMSGFSGSQKKYHIHNERYENATVPSIHLLLPTAVRSQGKDTAE